MPQNAPIFQGLFQDLDQHIKNEIARRLRQAGISGSTISASNISGNLPTSSVNLAASAMRIVPAAETIPAGTLVGYTADGNAVLADASARIKAKGFALAAIASGSSGAVYTVGILSGLTGRTVGATQYLSTAGTLSETPAITSNHLMQIVGTAISTTEVAFDPQLTILLA